MSKLNSTTKLVKAILEQDERARNSDSYLYLRVIDILSEKNQIDISKMTVTAFLLNMNAMQMPPFESVRRTRQYVQARHPELASKEKVAKMRKEKEVEYRNFARSEIL